MQISIDPRPLRRLLRTATFGALLVLAATAHAARVGGEVAPSAAAVQGLAQQPAQLQNDESASLRHGTITALDASGKRIQVQGLWLELVDGKSIATRNGRPVELGSLKVGETIRFTAVAGTVEAASLRLIYAP